MYAQYGIVAEQLLYPALDIGERRHLRMMNTPEQQAVAGQKLKEAAVLWPNPIVTEIVPLDTFYPAEDYHQEYFANNPNQGYCQFVIAPKVAKFRKQYIERLKA